MALTVEEDAYIDIAYANAYWDNRDDNVGWVANATDSEKEAAIRWATEELDTRYRWVGEVESFSQSLNWPRVNAYDRQGRYLQGIPSAVEKATAYLAGQHYNGNAIFQAQTRGGKIDSIKAGSVKVEYSEHAPVRTRFPYIDRILADITQSNQISLHRT